MIKIKHTECFDIYCNHLHHRAEILGVCCMESSSPMAEKRINVDHILIPSSVIRKVMETTLKIVMPDAREQIVEDIKNAGIRLDDKTAYYSLSQIRDYLHLVLGNNGAEVLTDVMRNVLQRNLEFEKYG